MTESVAMTVAALVLESPYRSLVLAVSVPISGDDADIIAVADPV